MCFYLHLQILDDSQRREPVLPSALLTMCFSSAFRERHLSVAPVSAAVDWKAASSVQQQFKWGAAWHPEPLLRSIHFKKMYNH